MWSIPGLLLVAVGMGAYSYAPALAMFGDQGVGIRGEDAEDVIRRVLLRDFRLIEDPSTSTFQVASETTHTLWLVSTDLATEPGLQSHARVLRAQDCGFVDSTGRAPKLRSEPEVQAGRLPENEGEAVISIGSVELWPGTWHLEVPEPPPGTQYAVSYAELTLDDMAQLYPTATRNFQLLGIGAAALGVLLVAIAFAVQLWRR